MSNTRIVAISDTHNHTLPSLPEGDVLVHAGDLTGKGSIGEIDRARHWLAEHPHAQKILTPGNHDFGFEDFKWILTEDFANDRIDVRMDAEVHLGEHLIPTWLSPWSPPFFDWAFMRGRDIAMRYWKRVPKCDVVISHAPPHGILDDTDTEHGLGCEGLLWYILERRPALVICGHIHESYGHRRLKNGTLVCNVSVCDKRYRPVNAPYVIDLEVTNGKTMAVVCGVDGKDR